MVLCQFADHLAGQPTLQRLYDRPDRQPGGDHRVRAQTQIQLGLAALKTRGDIVDAGQRFNSRLELVAQTAQHRDIIADDLDLHRSRLLADHAFKRGLVQLILHLQLGNIGQLFVNRPDELRQTPALIRNQRDRQGRAIGSRRVADIGQARRIHTRTRINRRHLIPANCVDNLPDPLGHPVRHLQAGSFSQRYI